jgi:hypothetical protein
VAAPVPALRALDVAHGFSEGMLACDEVAPKCVTLAPNPAVSQDAALSPGGWWRWSIKVSGPSKPGDRTSRPSGPVDPPKLTPKALMWNVRTCHERSKTVRLPGNLLAVPNRLYLVWWVVPGMMDSGIRGDVRRTYLLYVHGLEFPSSGLLAPSLQQKFTPTVPTFTFP